MAYKTEGCAFCRQRIEQAFAGVGGKLFSISQMTIFLVLAGMEKGLPFGKPPPIDSMKFH